jgi:hypothetical protein
LTFNAFARLQLDTMWLIVDDYLHRPDFDVSSDAFSTFKDLFTVSVDPKIVIFKHLYSV